MIKYCLYTWISDTTNAIDEREKRFDNSQDIEGNWEFIISLKVDVQNPILQSP